MFEARVNWHMSNQLTTLNFTSLAENAGVYLPLVLWRLPKQAVAFRAASLG